MAKKIERLKSLAREKLAACVPKTRPRDRIVVTARDLFHQHGIRGIGVDAIADAAGTNKMTLYRHFGSKDELIVECLAQVAQDGLRIWDDLAAAFPGDPRAQLRSWIDIAAGYIKEDGRGCEMANAAIELTEIGHPARRVIEEFKTEQRNRLGRLCAAAGATQAELLADALSLLLEGARVSRQSVGPGGPSAEFVRMSEVILRSFGVGDDAAPAPDANADLV
jgi:AcrR family transcriptional regulator